MKPKESSGSNFELPEPGNYVSRCFQLIHFGTIPTEFNGKQKMLSKVLIGWELPTECVEFVEGEGEKPFALNKIFTNSSNQKSNLFKFMNAWSPKINKENFGEFDLKYVMGEDGLINLGHNPSKKDSTKKYLEAVGIGPVPKGMDVPKPFNPQFVFDIDEGFEQEKFNQLPKFMRDMMVSSEEFKALELNPNEVEKIAAEARGETQQKTDNTSNQPESTNLQPDIKEEPEVVDKKGNFF